MMTLTKVKSFIEYFWNPAFDVQARELTQSQTQLKSNRKDYQSIF